ncbi:MAG: iron chelate uptake ABC transporter family permease subunit [Actinomycetota bacterium]
MLTAAGGLEPRLTWNLVQDVRQTLEFPFMVNAFRAGFIVAVLSGLVGWFMVLRRESFAGHTLAIVGFPGAAGAVLIGVSATYGLFAFALVAAVLIGVTRGSGGRGYGAQPAVIGTIQAFALACGFLFVNIYGGFLSGTTALLFGSFLGITPDQVAVLAVVAVIVSIVLAAIARPLLFASVDADVAQARGVPVRILSITFLVLLGCAAAEVSQMTGTLLVFALLVVPAATAQVWTPRPFASAVLTVVIGVCVTWLSLFAAYYSSSYPIGFFLTSFAFAAYLLANGWRRLRDHPASRPGALV